MKSQRCESCGALVVWIRPEKGEALICDARPRMGHLLTGEFVRVHELHFLTCPGLGKSRKR